MSRGAGSSIAGFLARAGQRVISLARGQRIRVRAYVALSPLPGRLFGLLLFALALQDRLLAFPRHDGLPAAPALTASASASATATAVGLGLCFVDVQRPPIELLPVERIDGCARRAVRHGHESEAARPPRVPVGDHRDLLDIAVLGERVSKRVLVGVEAQVSYIDLQGSISKLVRAPSGLAPVVAPSSGFRTRDARKPNGHGTLLYKQTRVIATRLMSRSLNSVALGRRASAWEEPSGAASGRMFCCMDRSHTRGGRAAAHLPGILGVWLADACRGTESLGFPAALGLVAVGLYERGRGRPMGARDGPRLRRRGCGRSGSLGRGVQKTVGWAPERVGYLCMTMDGRSHDATGQPTLRRGLLSGSSTTESNRFKLASTLVDGVFQ